MKTETIIKIPENVEVSLSDKYNNDVNSNQSNQELIYAIKGPLGSTSINFKKLDKNGIASIRFDPFKREIIIRSLDSKYNGLYKKLLENKFIGVSRGFCVYLEIVGVGYRASLDTSLDTALLNDTLFLKLGYSHDVQYKIPKGVRVFLQSPSEICIFGVDLNQVTQVAHSIRAIRPPSVYKGKGIRLSTEKIITKAGK